MTARPPAGTANCTSGGHAGIPGPPLEVLHPEYASVAGPVLAFIGRPREQRAEQIVVLIPVATPDRLRHRFLHDHLGPMPAAAPRSRAGIATARVPVLLHLPDRQHGASTSALSQARREAAMSSTVRRRAARRAAAGVRALAQRAATFSHDQASGS